jgi:hypothetical protein
VYTASVLPTVRRSRNRDQFDERGKEGLQNTHYRILLHQLQKYPIVRS